MKHRIIILLMLAAIAATAPSYGQVRSVVRDSVDFAARSSSDTTRNTWPTMLTVRWMGAEQNDTLAVRFIPDGGGKCTLPFYNPMSDAVDTLLVRSAPLQSVYLWSRKNSRVFVQRASGIAKTGSAAIVTFE